ncbi:MAG: hypothetical protein GY814_15630 [Gammaproteobacteria bacterium]|nr:hypothetical protein [Gammaproteobacteria bacterium]
MKPWLLLLFTWCLPLTAAASHQWAGIDLCAVYKDALPPGLTIESLPEPKSSGADLLQQYCTQCHNLPGPNRHTASEWGDVTSKMFMLMDVSNRFGGLNGEVDTMQSHDQKALQSYLERHATQSMVEHPPNPHWMTRLWVLLPFLLLMGVGMLRWWKR